MKIDRLSHDAIRTRAASAVRKIDHLGPRGVTLCSMEEIEAMACLIALADLLPAPDTDAGVTETPKFRTRRKA